MIEKEAWRIPLVLFEEGMFNSSGFVHVACGASDFCTTDIGTTNISTTDIVSRLIHFGPELTAEAQAHITRLLG
jgi:hypothetical protein